VEKRRGLGMFVTANAQQRLKQREKELFLQQEWPEILQRIHDLGIDIEPLVASLRKRQAKHT